MNIRTADQYHLARTLASMEKARAREDAEDGEADDLRRQEKEAEYQAKCARQDFIDRIGGSRWLP